MCEYIHAGVKSENAINIDGRLEEELLIWKMNCEVNKWGPKNYIIHMFYPKTDTPIPGTQSMLEMEEFNNQNKILKYMQSDYFKYTVNPSASVITFNDTYLNAQ